MTDYVTLQSDWAVNATLSNGDLTASAAASPNTENKGVYAGPIASAKQKGKVYFEAVYNVVGTGDTGFGIAVPRVDVTSISQGSNTRCAICYRSGNIYANGGNSSKTIGTITAGQTIGCAVDLSNGLIWFKNVSTGGNWNGTSGADPATGTGGITFNRKQGVLPILTLGGNAITQMTGNFGASAFVGTVPSGFTSGWEMNVGKPDTTAVVTQDYGHLGGSGLRSVSGSTANSVFTVTQVGTATIAASLSLLFHGDTNDNGFYWSGASVNNCGLQIEFPEPRIIDAFKLYKQTGGGGEGWDFQAFDGSTWISLKNWTVTTGTSQEETFTNTTAYTKYRWVGIGGGAQSSNYWYEFEMQIDGVPLQRGNRVSLAEATSSVLLTLDTSPLFMLDGDETTGSLSTSWYPSTADPITGLQNVFILQEAIVCAGVYMRHSTNDNKTMGTWRWQGTNDGVNWTTLSSDTEWTTAASLQKFEFDLWDGTSKYSTFRMLGVSGTPNTNAWLNEMWFDIPPDGLLPPPETFMDFGPLIIVCN